MKIFGLALVPEGYILCFPTTEMGFSPNHQFFADDLKFISSSNANRVSNKFLYFL